MAKELAEFPVISVLDGIFFFLPSREKRFGVGFMMVEIPMDVLERIKARGEKSEEIKFQGKKIVCICINTFCLGENGRESDGY